MLYRTTPIQDNEIEEYIFDTKPFNEDIDIKDIAALEKFFYQKKYIPERYIELFLNYVIYYARYNSSDKAESAYFSSLKGRCSVTANIIEELLKKIGINYLQFNIGYIVHNTTIHQLIYVKIPTMINGELTTKNYILDPTFRQFCLKEENRFERYFEERRYWCNMSTPHPGYFFNLTEEGKNLAEQLIEYGYFEDTDENLKLYCDCFTLYVTPKEKYKSINDLGKVYTTDITAETYRSKISEKSILSLKPNFDIQTPLEIVKAEQNKLKNRIKTFLSKKNEFESDLDLDDEGPKL